MSDYRVADLSGQRWTRCARVIIENPLAGQPTAHFIEEEALLIGEDEVVTRLSGSCALEASDPALEIPLRDVATWGADRGQHQPGRSSAGHRQRVLAGGHGARCGSGKCAGPARRAIKLLSTQPCGQHRASFAILKPFCVFSQTFLRATVRLARRAAGVCRGRPA